MLQVDFQRQLGGFHLRPSFAAEDAVLVLFGPSGAGKSLTLRAIAGLLRPAAGRIALPHGVVFDSRAGIDLPPQQRSVGYVVQDLALFPHLSVADNLAYSLRRRPRAEVARRVAELVDLLGLSGLEARRPHEISGGQQQRVALGRALAAEPALLLLDEPFSALDAPVRASLRRELISLQRRMGFAVIFVTHDLDEAYAIAGTIAVLDAGGILQCGPREEILQRPASERVAELLDARNIFRGEVAGLDGDTVEVKTPWFTARAQSYQPETRSGSVAICIRPEHVLLLDGGPHPLEGTVLPGRIIDEEASASSHSVRLVVDSEAGACVVEARIPDVEYGRLGIASRRDWLIYLPDLKTVAVPISHSGT